MEKLASNHHQRAHDRTTRKPGVLELDVFTTLSPQIGIAVQASPNLRDTEKSECLARANPEM